MRTRTASLARRIAFPLWFAARRIAAARRPLSVAAFGVALAACALAIAFAAAAVVENRAVADAIDELPPSSRDVEVTWVGTRTSPSERLAGLEPQAHAALASVGLRPSARTLAYREARIGGRDVRLAATDALSRWFALRRGRFPRVCTPARCETVLVGEGAGPEIRGLAVVGVAEPRPGTPVRRLLGNETRSVPILVAADVPAADGLPMFDSVFRSFTWSSPLASGRLTAWTLDDFEHGLTQARTRLEAKSPRFGLSAPLDSLDDVAVDARIAYRRLLLIGGECAVLFLVFAIVAAASLRSSALSSSRRLRRYGARRWQADLVAGAEATAIVVPAAVVGWAAGGVAAVVLAAATDTPRTALLERTILSGTGVGVLASLAALAAVIVFVTTRARPVIVRGRGLSVVDAAAVAAIVAVAVALASGQTDPETLARDRGTGFFLLLVPGLVIVAGAIVAARLTGPLFRLAERVAPRARPLLRLALLSTTRNAGTQLVTVGFLVVSVGLAMFAATYRSTLIEGEHDQAAFAVPLDYAVRNASSHGQPVGDAYDRWNGLPVIRRAAQARSLNLTETIDVLGLPSGSLGELRWRSDFAGSGPAQLGRQIAPPRSVAPVGPRLPADAEMLTLRVTARGDPFVVTASVRANDGAYVTLDLGEARRGASLLRARVPREAQGGTIVGVALALPPAEAFSATHAAAEGGAPSVFSGGTLTFSQPRVSTPHGSRRVPVDYRTWVLATESSPAASRSRDTLRIRYLLTQERAFRLRPRQRTDDGPIPVIACSSLAERVDGAVPLSIGSAVVNVVIVARARFFPSLRCPFVVADVDALEAAVTAAAPGAAVADEAWIAGPPGLGGELERAADGVPVALTSRRALEAELRDDPLASGTVAVLAAGSLLALVLAVLSVFLVALVELRDEAGDYFDLEAQGMAPATLRRQLVLRLGSLAAFGIVCGLVVGAVLAAVVTDVVAIGAESGTPVPPLRVGVAWPEIVLGLVAVAFALGVILAATARRAFAGPVPRAARSSR